jgi:hypothetical protein
VSAAQLPTLFWLDASDTALHASIRFTAAQTRRDTGAWWKGRQVATTRAVPCQGEPSQ